MYLLIHYGGKEKGQERYSVATSKGYLQVLAHNGSGSVDRYYLNSKSWIVVSDISPSNYKLPERQSRIYLVNHLLQRSA